MVSENKRATPRDSEVTMKLVTILYLKSILSTVIEMIVEIEQSRKNKTTFRK
jgi:hypothetical protein